MNECKIIMECGDGTQAPDYPTPEHAILESFVVYNYFCLKICCFQAFFGREKGVMKNCPNCGMNDQVVARFE